MKVLYVLGDPLLQMLERLQHLQSKFCMGGIAVPRASDLESYLL